MIFGCLSDLDKHRSTGHIDDLFNTVAKDSGDWPLLSIDLSSSSQPGPSIATWPFRLEPTEPTLEPGMLLPARVTPSAPKRGSFGSVKPQAEQSTTTASPFTVKPTKPALEPDMLLPARVTPSTPKLGSFFSSIHPQAEQSTTAASDNKAQQPILKVRVYSIIFVHHDEPFS